MRRRPTEDEERETEDYANVSKQLRSNLRTKRQTEKATRREERDRKVDKLSEGRNSTT